MVYSYRVVYLQIEEGVVLCGFGGLCLYAMH